MRESLEKVEMPKQLPISNDLPRRGVVFDSKAPLSRRRNASANKLRYQAMIEAHTMEHPELPLDNKDVQRALGISATTLAKIKRASRSEGYEIPMTTREYAEWLRREAGIPKRPSSALLEAGKGQRMEKKKVAMAERKKLKGIVKFLRLQGMNQSAILDITSRVPLTISVSDGLIRKIVGELLREEQIKKHINDPRSPHERAVYDARVRVFYKLGLSYEEIAELVEEENLSNINNSLVRSDRRGLVERRKKVKHRKITTSSF